VAITNRYSTEITIQTPDIIYLTINNNYFKLSEMNWRKFPLWIYDEFASKLGSQLNKLPKESLLSRFSHFIERRLLLITLPNPIVSDKQIIYWNRRACIYAAAYSFGKFERDTRILFESILRPGMQVIDLGAYIGYFSLVAAKCVGKTGKIYAFEPDPTNFDLLIKNIHANKRESIIVPLQKAVSNQNGTYSLFLANKDGTGSSLYGTPAIGKNKVAVDTISLDNYLEMQGWPHIHLIKMDIEGAEKAALDGMKQLATRNPGLKLIMEFCPLNQVAAGVKPEVLFSTLVDLGFHKFSVIEEGQHTVQIPEDLPSVVQRANNGCVNIFCER
jgi:FkbM family methyltransferase